MKNRKILIEIKTDIAQREADNDLPDQLRDWFKKQLLEVEITPNYPENICKNCQFYQKLTPIFEPRCEELGVVILRSDLMGCKLFEGVKTV